MEKNIALFLMTYKGLQALRGLLDAGLAGYVGRVIVGRDKSVQQDYSAELAAVCEEAGLTWVFREQFDGVVPEGYMIAISWRWLIPADNARVVVLHDSLLPKYRGFAPLVSMLVNGEPQLGVTALFATEEYDRGPVIGRMACDIRYPLRIQDAIGLVSELYSALTVSVVQQLAAGRIEAVPQDEAEATYSLWRDDGDYEIDWREDAGRISRFIDATGYPYSGAFTRMDDQKLIIGRATALPDVRIENRTPGKIIFMRDDRPVVVCGTGLLQINEAIFAGSGESVFPLKKFRVRFR